MHKKLILCCFVSTASCQRGSIRIIVGDEDSEFYTMSNDLRETDYDSEFSVIDDMLSRGRIEICNGTSYEAVCSDGWDYNDASVVCREFGFSPYGNMQCNCHTKNTFVTLITRGYTISE